MIPFLLIAWAGVIFFSYKGVIVALRKIDEL